MDKSSNKEKLICALKEIYEAETSLKIAKKKKGRGLLKIFKNDLKELKEKNINPVKILRRVG